MIIVSRYKEDYSWVKEYGDDYLIINKDEDNPIYNDQHVVNYPNLGGNIYDIYKFIYDNYENLPNTMIFIQSDPFPHCNKEKFNKLINNKTFTPLESYEGVCDGRANKNDKDGGYMELNNSWYMYPWQDWEKQYMGTYNDYMNGLFEDYKPLEWVRFSPGAMYIVPKENIVYSKNFYKKIMEFVGWTKHAMESHLIERASYTILEGKLKEKNYELQ